MKHLVRVCIVAVHAAAASEVVPVLTGLVLSSLPVERGDWRTAGSQRTACGGQSCAAGAESRYFRAVPTGLAGLHQGASNQQTGARSQTQMAGNRQTRPGGGGLGNKRSLQVDMRSCLGRRRLWSGEVVVIRAVPFFPSSLAYID